MKKGELWAPLLAGWHCQSLQAILLPAQPEINIKESYEMEILSKWAGIIFRGGSCHSE